MNKEHNTITWDRLYVDMEPLYLATPQRPWVWLTRDERMDIINRFVGWDLVYAVDAVERGVQRDSGSFIAGGSAGTTG